MTTTHKQTPRVATRKSQEGIHRLQLTHTRVDKQTQQRVPLHLLPMGQMYLSTLQTPLPIRLCLKMCVAWGLVALYLLLVLGFQAVSMFVTLIVNE